MRVYRIVLHVICNSNCPLNSFFHLQDFENSRSFDPWGSTQSLDAAIDLREARGARANQMDGRGSEPFLHHSLSQDAPPIHHPRQLSDAGNYMFHSQESLENFPPEDQGLPPSSMAGYDQFGPPRDYHSMGRPLPRHKDFSPSPAPPMDPGLAPPKMPFHHNHPPPNQWQMPMMNHRPPLPNRPPPPWEQPGFRPIPPGYESPSPGPSPGPSPRATPPPTPPPPNHMMMGPGPHPPPPVPHHQRPHSAPMNRIPMGMPPRQPPPPLWNHGNMPPLAPPRGGPFPGHPPGHPPPPHGRFGPPSFQPEWDEWQQR